jgi:chromosome segregation ATPase
MKSAEIQTRISQMRKGITDNKVKLDSLRTNRGQLSIDNAEENEPVITRLDKQIEDLRKALENTPVEIRLLEEQLTQAQAKESQKQQEQLLSEQKKVGRDVEELSKQFIKALKAAKNINEQLQSAITTHTALAQRTGQQVLRDYCHGSEQSLKMLLETMEQQMKGQHTAEAGPGMVGSNAPIRL